VQEIREGQEVALLKRKERKAKSRPGFIKITGISICE
jgi:hypothetical protein